MSWTHSRQNGSLTSPLSQATSHPSQVVQNNSTTTSGFGHQHQQWPQATNYNQNLQQQPIPSNNWFNPTGQTVTQKIVSNPSQDWQQQPLQPPSIYTNTQYFPKQQQPTKPVENYQNQSFSTNFQQNSQQRSKNLNSNVNTQQKMSSQIQNNELFDQKTSNTDNWGDWGEWNDNNNPSLNNVNNQQQPQQLPINSQNIIEESFHNELNDNWSWNVDKNSSTGSVISQMADNKKIDVYNNGLENEMNNIISNFEDINFEQSGGETGSSQLGYIQNIQQTAPPFNQKQQQSSPPVLVHSPKQIINEQTVHSSPVNSHEHKNLPTSQLEQQTSSNDNSQNPVGSPVYVTQAKPVAQPSRQYALTPLTDPGDISSSVQQLLHNQQSSVLPNPTSSSPQSPPQTIGQVRQYTIQSGGIEHPGNSNSPGIGNLPPPPPPIVQNSLPVASTTNNPYKRAGAAQHHRNVAVAPPKTKQQSNVIPPQFYAPTLPDDFLKQQHNQEYLAPDNSEVIVDRTFEVENLEVAPNNDRNQYLQTGHLSEEGYNIHNIGGNINDQNNEFDNFPPPGLSRLVLGEPETSDTAQQHIDNQPEIPPGFDRMIPGTELVASDLNMVRQADGQDTIPSPRSAFTAVQRTEINDTSSNMDITTDRNLYLVPGDESDVHEHRVVTGVENGPNIQGTEQREIELDGENLEDQQQPQHQHPNHIDITRDEPLEGANTMDPPNNSPGVNHETESSLTVEMNLRDISNPSTGNDDSDHRDRPSSYFGKSNLRRTEEKRRRADHNDNGNTDKRKDKYETEESDLSSEKERRRYREGSVRNDRDKDRDSKDRDRREKRNDLNRDRDRYRDDKDRNSKRYDRDRQQDRHERGDRDRGRYNSTRYETDSKYETESSVRYERRRDRAGDRNSYEREHNRRDEKDGRYRRDHYERDDRRRNDHDYRDDRGNRDRRRGDRKDREKRNDFDDDYHRRTTGSRNNARDSDREREKERSGRDKDPRYNQHMYGYSTAYNYDAYSYYQQQQQYYEQLRRTNPQAYAEWYRKYYAGHMHTDTGTTDGRESVHSGRSSANNDKDRYNFQTIQQYYQQSNEYLHGGHGFGNSNSNINGIVGGGQTSLLNSTSISDKSYNLSIGNLSQHLLQQQQQQQQKQQNHLHQQIGGYHHPNSSARSFYTHEYLDKRSDNLSSLNLIDGDSTTQKNALQQDSQRLTPCKFTNEHSTVSLRNGLIICVKPNYSINGITNVVKILKFAGNDSTRRLYQSFPGPLIHGSTHKKTIIEFCEEQIRLGPPTPSSLNVIRSRQNSMSSICSFGQATNKASFTLMWNLLILLLRQNGRVIEPDIAELLMKNKTQFPYEYQQTNLLSKSSSRDSVQSSSDAINLNKQESVNNENNEIVHNNNDSEDEGEPTNDGSDELDLTSKKSSLNSDDITEKFRNHLLYGNVNEALEWATENNLWGHALFLASKVDKRSHAKVMMKFANKLSLNDPLQTLYQLMSGRTPSSVTCIQDEKWGDWRPHLAMILSNTSQKPELYRKSITTLGDSLCSRGDLFGAQFCYLMAQVGFGKYSDANQDTKLLSNSANTVRLVLLGASHHKGFKEFATNEAIMMTEIYEYACTLNDEKFSIAEFQLYKYLLATRMLDYGYQLRTLMYMEQIALHIQRDPSKYEPTFIEQVYNLADRLKFYDPVLEKTIDDQLNLSDSSPTHQQQQSIDGSTQFEEQKWIQDLRNILNEYNSENSQLIQQQIDTNNYSVGGALDRTNIDQQFAEINQQFNALNSQYNNYDPIQQQQSLTSQNYIQTGFDDKQQQQLLQPDMTHVDQTQYTQQQQFYNPNNAAIIPQQQQQQPDSSISYDPNNAGYQQQPPSYDQQQPQNYGLDQQNQGFDYWGQSQQNEPTKPTITLPNSISNKPGFYDDDDDKTNLKPNQSNTLGAGPLTQKKSIKDNKNRSSNSTSTNSGWFGGIWNKLSMKPKNQMILPDDKNPAIVWDADKKKWVNTDGDDDGSESFKPPPKMSDLTGNNNNSAPPSIMSSGNPQQQFNQPQMYGAPLQTQQPQQQDIPTASSPGPSNLMSAAQSTEILSKTPSLQSNMFKMQRNRTLKKSYVDVFNPPGAVQSSKPTDPVLAPTLPPASIPQTGFFIPAPADDSQQQQLPQEGAPQFYNPNQYSGYQQ